MPTERSSAGDPARTLQLLWRAELEPARRRGPKPRLSVDAVVERATAIAGADGLEAVTMRRLAGDLGLSPMALYGYVPGKAELLDLMLDAAYLAMPRPAWRSRQGWRARLRAVARANRELYAAHPWAADVATGRPPLGPGLLAKYEHELAALDGTGLGDVATDDALAFLLGFVRGWALSAREATTAEAETGADDAAWWAAAGPLLARAADPERYPRATRIGTAAGEAQGGAYDPDRAWAFGLERVLDGLAALIDR